LWAGLRDSQGYGRTRSGQLAHRVAFIDRYGAIPTGLELDHLCRRRYCIRPEHLEPVTRSANELRKSFKRRSRKRKCAAGHDAFTHGLLTQEGGRICRLCAPIE
jgi:hypothetical protein